MLSFKEYLIEISLTGVKKTLSKGDPIGTVSPQREGDNRATRKKGHKAMQADLKREGDKGMVSWSGPHKGRYQYGDSKKGEVAKEGSYVVRPGKHPKAKSNFHRILTHLGKKHDQESVLKVKKQGKGIAGAFHMTTGKNKGKSESQGHIKYNKNLTKGSGDTMLKGRKSSFTVG
jgi:hypothetical protein